MDKMEIFYNSLDTPAEIISYGVVISIEGMLVVFAILILIMLTINAMKLFAGGNKDKKTVAEVPTDAADYAEDTVDEGELIAVLTAAVAACMGTSTASVNIKSYKKVSSAWGNAAKREILDNRF